ncbi:hypothetical protein HMPREF0005_05082, partial [Achromobacter xylosoxidans C54]
MADRLEAPRGAHYIARGIAMFSFKQTYRCLALAIAACAPAAVPLPAQAQAAAQPAA